MKKKIISIALALAMISTSFNGIPALAAEPNEMNKETAPQDQLESGNIFDNRQDIEHISPLLKQFRDDLKESQEKHEKVIYFVEYESEEDKDSVLKAIKKIKGTKVLYEYNIIFQGCSVETDPDNLEALQLIKGVKSVERSQKMEPMMNNVRKLIKVDEASNYLKSIMADSPEIASNYDGRGMLISHIDTGMDASHRAMRIDDDALPFMKIKKNDDPFWVSNKVPHAFNYMNGGKETIEKYDDGSPYYDPHGMHIAGILAGNDTEEDIENDHGMRGVAPNAQILSYKMYSDASDAFAGDETMFHAIEDSIKLDADVVSISSGFTGTGLVGEKYWPAIRALRKHGIPIFVATGNFATSASNSSWDYFPNNALNMTDTGNVTRTAAHEDAIAVGSSRNTVIKFPGIAIGENKDSAKKFRYSQIGAFFDKANIPEGDYDFIYLGKCQDEDILGKDLTNKIVVMDRIYTKDLKYAFKKVQDKGAIAVIVVNTVSYYNRDNWEKVPAMGYERDEKTHVQVISISGDDGVVLWDMMKPKAQVRSLDYEKTEEDIKEYNAKKPEVGQEKTLNVSFPDELISWKDMDIPAGSTSWGPRNDLMLKPDLSAPGKNIYSTLNKLGNKNDYAYMSGTSMATPVAAGASVIIRPKLKEMLKSSVLKAAEIDLSSLTKIVMQNTATPMVDPSTGDTAEDSLFASPRQQGAGLINVERALKTGVIAAYKVKDSVGLYNSYGSISLKEINGGSKDFTIDLHNTSDKPRTFTVTASPVTTDGEKKVTKFDETYTDENSKEGKQVVAEIHPVVVDGASISFSDLNEENEITIPARSSIELEATINTGDAADQNKFVESFISFESKDSDQSSLSMPLMGFAGDWNNEPIIDKWAWEEGSKSGKIIVFDDEGKPKRPGTLNFGRGGEHNVDMFHPAGVIQNREDGNPGYDQDPELFALNTSLNLPNTGSSPSDTPSATDSKLLDKMDDYAVNNAGLTPNPLVLRSASDAKIYIENESGKDLRTMAVQHFVRGILNSKRNTAKGLKTSLNHVPGDFKWDGTVFNPHREDDYGDVSGDLDPVSEGQYYYTFKYRLTPDYDWQVSKIPIRVDNTAPTLESVDLSNPDEVKIVAKDTYHKPKDIEKTYFLRDQKKNPSDFVEVPSKVWYVGAGFVDEDGQVTKKLKVLRTDKDGEYVIKDANESLAGKTIEIIVLDGAGNFSKVKRYKFADQITDNKLNYEVYQYEMTKPAEGFNPAEFEFKKIDEAGSIDAAKLKDAPEKTPDTGKKEEDVKVPSGTPKIHLIDNQKSLAPLEDSDLKKIVKPKEFEDHDYVNNTTKKVLDYGENCEELDKDGLPKYYDHLTADYARIPMEYTYETRDGLKKNGLESKVILNKNGGFRIAGNIENVSKNAKVYFQSASMKKTGDKKDIPTFDYNSKDNTMKFDFYGNRKDVQTTGGAFNYNGDITIYVKDIKKDPVSVSVRMPKEKKDSDDPNYDPLLQPDDYAAYLSSLKNINEFKHGDLDSHKILESKDELGKTIYKLQDTIKLKKGYALRIISYNAGKTSTEPLSDKTYYAEPSKLGDGDSGEQSIYINILQGFNVIRYEVHKPQVDSNGNFVKNTDGEVVLNDKTQVFEKGRCVYFDKDALQLKMDPYTFNPWVPNDNDSLSFPILFTRNSPMTLKGIIGDKGGFMWHLRINQNIIDEYIIYGDLKVDNSRPFNFTFDVKNGDIMDWGAKDYSGNGMPEEEYDTGIKRTIPDKFKIYIDDKKPDIEVSTTKIDVDSSNEANRKTVSYTLTGDEGKTLYIVADDYINDDKKIHGRIQESVLKVNGKIYTGSKDDLPTYGPSEEDPWNIEVVASDYARNRSVKKFIFDGDNVKEKAIKQVTITYDLGKGSGDISPAKITIGEDCILPNPDDIKAPKGKVFDCWNILGEKKEPGYVFNVQKSLTIKAVYKDNDKRENCKLTFDLNGGKGDRMPVKIKKGDSYTLPQLPDVEAPEGKIFAGWTIKGTEYKALDKIEVNGDITLKAMWKNKPAEPEKKPEKPEKPEKENPTQDTSSTIDTSQHAGTPSISANTTKPSDKKDNTTVEKPKLDQGTAPVATPVDQSKGQQTAKESMFKDISTTYWAKDSINYVVEKGYFKGVDANHFAPNRTITRGEFATVLGRIAGVDISKLHGKNFTDVNSKKFYAPYIEWANEQGIVKGVGNNKFEPDREINREEMCVVLIRFIQNQGIKLEVKKGLIFKDKSQISSWALPAVEEMTGFDLINGMGNGTFSPKTGFTRAQVSQVLYRLYNK